MEKVTIPKLTIPIAPIEDLKELAQKLFETQNTWDIVKNGAVVEGYDALTKIEKAVA